MIKIDDIVKSGTPLGIAIGVGATVLAGAILPALPALARAAKPGARAAIKSGLILAEKGRETFAEVTEEFEDILAEARAELREANKAKQSHTPEQSANSSDPGDS